ncbi:MAG: HEAT repeat protein [Planctomycetota bacterium]
MTDEALDTAPHSSRLGQLQRGRGAGFRAAIAAGSDAHSDVLQCVIRDPRVDGQIESRERYYAELLHALDAPIAPIVAHLTGSDSALGHGVLAGAWRLGHLETRALLVDTNSDEAVVTGVARQLWNFAWAKLVELEGRAAKAFLHEALQVANCAESSRRRQTTASLPGEMSIADLLELGRQMHHSQRWAVVEELCRRGTEEDREALAKTVNNDLVYDRVRLAASALGTLGDERLLWVVDDYFAREDVFADATRRLDGFDRMRRSALTDYVQHLPMDRQLELARAWHTRGGYFEMVAGKIFGAQATPDDRTRIEAFIEEQGASGNSWEVLDELIALGRIGDPRSAPLLVQVAEQATYSLARRRALQALSGMQQLPIASDALHEALWDCEDESIDNACEHLSTLDPAAHARIATLAKHPLAEEPLRIRASSRLPPS